MGVVRNEFQKSQFNFTYDNPEDFAVWSWQTNRAKISGYFISYRFFVAALFLSILVSYGTIEPNPSYFFIYMTNLGFIVETLHLAISAFVPIQFLLQEVYKYQMSGLLKWTLLGRFSWFLYNVVNFSSIAITVIYWIALYKPGNQVGAMNFLVHGFNSIVTIVDILVSGRPCRLMHFYHPFVFWLAYLAFSAIYWAAGGLNPGGYSYIYPVLDWDNLGLTVPFVVIGLFVALPIVHTLLWGLHLLRDFIVRKFVQQKSDYDLKHQIKQNGGRNNEGFE